MAISLHELPARSREILKMIAEEALSNKEIAYRMGLSEVTVKYHIKTMMKRLDANNRVGCALLYWRAKLETSK
jgi:DNA-binding NarL/FixJ family response regulator